VSEEKSIAERLAGLETQQGTIQRTLDEMKASMAKMTDAFTRYMTAAASLLAYQKYKIRCTGPGNSGAYSLWFYERPTARFYRGLNKVKDRTDTEVYWVNLGYATVGANGAITALTHYTDLRNNYPGGMRVEA